MTSQAQFEQVKPVRLYQRIVEQVEEAVARGDLKPGSRLPSERELVVQFGASRPTNRIFRDGVASPCRTTGSAGTSNAGAENSSGQVRPLPTFTAATTPHAPAASANKPRGRRRSSHDAAATAGTSPGSHSRCAKKMSPTSAPTDTHVTSWTAR